MILANFVCFSVFSKQTILNQSTLFGKNDMPVWAPAPNMTAASRNFRELQFCFIIDFRKRASFAKLLFKNM
jgi:hypothetical protein